MAQVDTNLLMTAEIAPVMATDRNRTVSRLAWFMLGLSLAIFLAALTMLLLVPGYARGSNDYTNDYLIGFILLSYPVLGTLIATRHPHNPIGWIFITMGLGSELHILAVGYLTYAHFLFPQTIETPLTIFSLLINLWIIQRAFGPMGLLIFPNGRLLSPRWRIIAWLPVGLGVAWYFFTTPTPVAGLSPSLFHPLIRFIFPAIYPAFDAPSRMVIEPLIEVFLVIATIGIVLRLRKAKGEQREQLKWFVYACVLATAITLGLTLFDSIPINRSVITGVSYAATRTFPLLPYLAYVLIPLAASVAIFKYHLYDIDLIINRTLVYVPLTAILAGSYAASVTLFQRLFIASTGQKSDAAVVMSTLILAGIFTPIKNRIQETVDSRYKEPRDSLSELKTFDKQIEAITEVINIQHATRRLLDIAISAFKATCGAMYLERAGSLVLAHASEDWQENCGVISFQMRHDGIKLGVLILGARQSHKGYTSEDIRILQQAVDHIAEMIWLTQVISQDERLASGRSYDNSE